VRLARAGALDVRITNFESGAEVELRLCDVDGEHPLVSWSPDPDGHTRLESLAPGTYRVRAEIGAWYRQPRCLAEARVETGVDQVATVELTLSDAPGPERLVELAGTLYVDPAWGDEDWVHLSADTVEVPPGTDDPEVTLREDGRWSAERVPPGRYTISVAPWTWCQIVDVGPTGNTNVRIAVPPPCEVEVRILASDSDEPLPIQTLTWCMQRPVGGLLNSEAAIGPGRFRFRAPVGTIELDVWDEACHVESAEVPLDPGSNRITLRGKRGYLLMLRFEDRASGTAVLVDRAFLVRTSIAGVSDPECRFASEGPWNDDAYVFNVTKPGRYRVVFTGEIQGYATPDEIEVDVPKEGMARAVVPLDRRG